MAVVVIKVGVERLALFDKKKDVVAMIRNDIDSSNEAMTGRSETLEALGHTIINNKTVTVPVAVVTLS